MSLKLIDKELKSKYAEALFKNEASYDKEIGRRIERLKIDYARNSNQVDAGSQIFLNKVRQKRSKWINDDLKYREYYRLICRRVHNRKLENLKSFFDKNANNLNQLDPASQLSLLQEQLRLKEMTFIESEPTLSKRKYQRRSIKPNRLAETLTLEKSESELNPVAATASTTSITGEAVSSAAPAMTLPTSRVPRLPPLERRKIGDDFEDLYSRYSQSDRQFIQKFPAKVELTVTDVGKKFIDGEKKKHLIVKKNKRMFTSTQENALDDQRYKNLVSYLVSHC